MSEFFRALEQAGQDRLKTLAARQAAAAAETPAPPAAAPAEPAVASEPAPAVSAPVAAAPVDSVHPAAPAVERDGAGRAEPADDGWTDSAADEGFDQVETADDADDEIDDHFVSLLEPSGFEAEQYRALRHLVEQLHRSADLTVVAISSPGIGDGKTTTAVNLAGSLAQAPDARVLIIDADFRRPALARQLGIRDPEAPGLIDAILRPNVGLKDVVQNLSTYNLSVVPAGESLVSPYELLKSARMRQLIEEARREYDYVVIDTPPLVAVPDCRILAECVDGFIVLVTAHKTPMKMLGEALGVIDPGKIIGLVFNSDDRAMAGGYYYGYGSSNGAPRPPGWAGRFSALGSPLKRLRFRTRRRSGR